MEAVLDRHIEITPDVRGGRSCIAGTRITVADVVINVQTGTGNRIEFWDANGTPLGNRGKVRRFIDVGRLTKGR